RSRCWSRARSNAPRRGAGRSRPRRMPRVGLAPRPPTPGDGQSSGVGHIPSRLATRRARNGGSDMQAPAIRVMQAPFIGATRRPFAERHPLIMSVVALGWPIKYFVPLALVHTTGPELYGVLTAALATGSAVANLALLRSPRMQVVAIAAVLV